MNSIAKRLRRGHFDYNNMSMAIYDDFVKRLMDKKDESIISVRTLAHDVKITTNSFYYYYPEGVISLSKDHLSRWLKAHERKIYMPSLTETFVNLSECIALKDSDVMLLKLKLRRPQFMQLLAWLIKEVIIHANRNKGRHITEEELLREHDRHKDTVFGKLFFTTQLI